MEKNLSQHFGNFLLGQRIIFYFHHILATFLRSAECNLENSEQYDVFDICNHLLILSL